MSNIIELGNKDNEECIALLTEMLKLAKKGELQEVLILSTSKDKDMRIHYSGISSVATTVGKLEIAKSLLINDGNEEDEDG